uniref:Triple QxxK/R motif-containing protein n=1 Tax=Geotrypetes seraphini TaxID=260995 RepID=A0A6P8QRR9_GEOSA|nr:triple QxxK/R motif-containing protein isoform X1 [Geotrypetes seraphini]XP_033789276.1 triple QxxK/R motif-containing protein isoform X1 [Geotrypetes seraphini]XP_033789277.1 triple QxxK/R motif-containing protein isoform X1 [Geotrypetes seraphini]
MGRKEASASKLPVDQYRKQIGKQDYKKNKPVLRAARLKAEAKKTAPGIKRRNQFLQVTKSKCQGITTKLQQLFLCQMMHLVAFQNLLL